MASAFGPRCLPEAGLPRREADPMKPTGRWRERRASVVRLFGRNRMGLVGLAMLGLAIGTCKAQLHRARHLMRARMKPEATS